jgi:NADH dehydrogenase (ubiquinone) Fe-S protein 4
MGWTSSADSLEQAAEAHLLFQSRDAAAAFCRRNGWGYEIAEEKPTRKERPKRFLGYGDNFRRAAAALA